MEVTCVTWKPPFHIRKPGSNARIQAVANSFCGWSMDALDRLQETTGLSQTELQVTYGKLYE